MMPPETVANRIIDRMGPVTDEEVSVLAGSAVPLARRIDACAALPVGSRQRHLLCATCLYRERRCLARDRWFCPINNCSVGLLPSDAL